MHLSALRPLALAAVVLVPVTGHAEGLYLVASAGLTQPERSDLSARITPYDVSAEVRYDRGSAWSVGVGYERRVNRVLSWAVEAEHVRHSAGLRSLGGFEVCCVSGRTVRVPGSVALSGDVEASAWLASGLLRYAGTGPVRPYAGLGVGVAEHEAVLPAQELEVPRGGGTVTYAGSRVSESGAAYQVRLGAEYELTEGVLAGLGYRALLFEEVRAGGAEVTMGAHVLELTVRWRM